MLAIAPTSVFALALVVGLAKGRYTQAALALGAWVVCAAIAVVAIGTIEAGDAPLSDAWLVVLLQLASWIPALVAAAGPARPDPGGRAAGEPWRRSR